jgi:hypothetical protein
MANQWSIDILDAPRNRVGFRPDVPGAAMGDPLHAEPNDLVSWSNRTDRDLVLESTDPSGLALDQELKAGETSASLFLVPSDGTEKITYVGKDRARRTRKRKSAKHKRARPPARQTLGTHVIDIEEPQL